ncbi:MAG: hypothetical protein F4186_06505 [Boseongicola sp. SB0676_bin_33]|nr:hypothetical protein [Boseongicola sp. SB0676_bin_33]
MLDQQHHVDVAGQEVRGFRRQIREQVHLDGVEVGLALDEVVIVSHQPGNPCAVIALHLEGPGAVHDCVEQRMIAGQRLLRHDSRVGVRG